MDTGICLQAYIPLRKKPSGASEMVSQLLFGETYTVLQKVNDWYLIETVFDQYNGYIAGNCHQMLNENDKKQLQQSERTVLSHLYARATNAQTGHVLSIATGSTLYNFKKNLCIIAGQKYTVEILIPAIASHSPAEEVVNTAQLLLHVPYLWGGRSAFGTDCSGLVQTCFNVAGITLPRDAWQQATSGQVVENADNARMADVAFFNNPEGRIVHTGILLNNKQIIHASGRVRIDPFNNKGIYNTENQIYTHTLSHIMRIF